MARSERISNIASETGTRRKMVANSAFRVDSTKARTRIDAVIVLASLGLWTVV